MGYHSREITKGELGKVTKVMEEYEELMDAFAHRNPVMVLVELSDLIGAIEAFSVQTYNISLIELITMMETTKKAFEEGRR